MPIYNCIACDKKLKGKLNELYINCDKCHGNICDKCNDTHIQEFPTHKLKLVKYLFGFDNNNKEKYKDNSYENKINDKENINFDLEEKSIEKPRIKVRSKKININDDFDLNKLNNRDIISNMDKLKGEHLSPKKSKKAPHEINCISCNSKINNFNDCKPCYGYICNSCFKGKKNTYEIINQEKVSSFSSAIINCKICDEYLLKDINNPINYCLECNGNLCSNCSMNHFSQYPEHNLHLSKFILTQYISNNDKHFSNQNVCFDCNKNLDKNKLIHFCNHCKGKICLECVERHNNEYPEHIIILLKKLGSNQKLPGTEEKSCVCYLCKLNHYEAQNKKYFYCKECNNNICESCKNKHDEKNYSHIILNSHNYEEDKIKK